MQIKLIYSCKYLNPKDLKEQDNGQQIIDHPNERNKKLELF